MRNKAIITAIAIAVATCPKIDGKQIRQIADKYQISMPEIMSVVSEMMAARPIAQQDINQAKN